MPLRGRILGIDYGHRRVGLAISDPSGRIAFPFQTIDRRKSPAPLEDQIASIVQDHDIGKVVVGLPLTERGEKGTRALEVESFITSLKRQIGCEVSSFDERFSSARAVKALHEMGERTGDDKGRVDQISATLILQNFLDRSNRDTC